MLDLFNDPHVRRAAMERYFGIKGHRLSQHEITLTEGTGYRDITAQLSAAKAMGKLDEVTK